MARPGKKTPRSRPAAAVAILALAGLAAAGGCARPSGSRGADGSAECARLRDDVKRAKKRLIDLREAAPAPDASLDVVATHTDAMAKAARDVAHDFAEQGAPGAGEVKDAHDGIRMLGDLAGGRLEVLAKSLHGIAQSAAELNKVEAGANDAAQGLGPDSARDIGCERGKAGGCAAVVDALDASLRPSGVPLSLTDAARASRVRAGLFDDLARAADALAPPPGKQAALADFAKRAKTAADGYRALARAFEELGPAQERMAQERQTAQEAMTRLTAELEAAGRLCGAPAASASARASASSAPAPPTASSH